jgi:hypothetical protein
MNAGRKSLNTIVLAVMLVGVIPTAPLATSNVPEPGAIGVPINPDAIGKELIGSITLNYVISEDVEGICATGRVVENVFVVARFQKNKKHLKDKKALLFNRALNPEFAYCFIDETPEIQLVMDLVAQQVIPAFFGPCRPDDSALAAFRHGPPRRGPRQPCPEFEIKSIPMFESSGTGALRLDVLLAVHKDGRDDDD